MDQFPGSFSFTRPNAEIQWSGSRQSLPDAEFEGGSAHPGEPEPAIPLQLEPGSQDQAEDLPLGPASASARARAPRVAPPPPESPPTSDGEAGNRAFLEQQPGAHTRYRALVEQIPAIVFTAYMDRETGEAYLSPQVQETLGFQQRDLLEDPAQWVQWLHPADRQRWKLEAAQLFLSGKPLRSAYRLLALDGRTVWFQCDAKMVWKPDGRPWFVHGVAIDISDRKHAEEELEEERDVASAILDTVGALVMVLDPAGRVVRFNRACEETAGISFDEVSGRHVTELFTTPAETERFEAAFQQLRSGHPASQWESHWIAKDGRQRLIEWSSSAIHSPTGALRYIIATGVDITERKRLEKTILEVSGREQRRIGQDLHDGLGQHLTGIAFLSKALEQRLVEHARPEASSAAKIVDLVNQSIHKTRELARGLLPVLSDSRGLMTALEQWADEVEDIYRISCQFECDEPVLIQDGAVANHLYHIAQEAVNNAIKHGKAPTVLIRLHTYDGCGTLAIQDHGAGIRESLENQQGMGLRIMNYRAKMIGGLLSVRRNGGGTLVSCVFPMNGSRSGDE